MTIHEILKKYWGYDKFRPMQEDIIQSIISGKDTLALLPTGGGKSLCFQVPGMYFEGLCLVISPLIALMKDQVENLKQRGIPAKALISGMHMKEIDATLEEARKGKLKFLYVSPERLESEIFLARVDRLPISLLAIDESHCISQWGYDFRPSYLKIASIRKHIKAPVIALTATATPEVVTDIQDKLEFREKNIFKKSFVRDNLAYLVIKEDNKLFRLLNILNKTKGSGVIYVRNRKKTEEIADFLRRNDVKADFYHAGLEHGLRDRKQHAWKTGDCRVIVCTNAFGMGIDKPDVRFVVHLDTPDCLEAYFQEAGRAGRDEQKAFAVILFDQQDIEESEKRTAMSFPPVEDIKKVYQALGNYFGLATGSGKNCSFDLDLPKFSRAFNLSPLLIYNSLKFLEKEEYLTFSEDIMVGSRFKFITTKLELYDYQLKNKSAENFIRLLLRTCPGSFDDYVQIDEFDLARKAEISKESAIKKLTMLDQMKILSYLPRTRYPQVTYVAERLDLQNLRISPDNYLKRKEVYEQRLKEMLHYLLDDGTCRSRILVRYFGEDYLKDCGQCDYCLRKTKSSTSIEKYSLYILEKLKQGPVTGTELVKGYKKSDEDEVYQVIRKLLDEGKIRLLDEERLSL